MMPQRNNWSALILDNGHEPNALPPVRSTARRVAWHLLLFWNLTRLNAVMTPEKGRGRQPARREATKNI